jgi:hypothetical protein
MGLRGKGMLVVFSEVKARHERDFNEWYNREHIDERINMPGFRRARRYVAVRGAPKYLATYECERVSDLATPGYLAVLANQTPWTQAVMARFIHFKRMTLRMQVDRTHGIGGALAAIRFVPGSGHRRILIDWLRNTAFPRAIKQPGMLGAAAGENDVDVANAPVQAKSMDNPKADEAEWLVLLEGADAEAVGAAARQLFKLSTLRPFGVRAAPVIGTYRFLFGNTATAKARR